MPAVSQYMTKQPWTIDRYASLAQAHALMREHRLRHLPVLDRHELVGIVSVGDLHLPRPSATSRSMTFLSRRR